MRACYWSLLADRWSRIATPECVTDWVFYLNDTLSIILERVGGDLASAGLMRGEMFKSQKYFLTRPYIRGESLNKKIGDASDLGAFFFSAKFLNFFFGEIERKSRKSWTCSRAPAVPAALQASRPSKQ